MSARGRRESFLGGAFALAAAGLFSRVLGAAYRIVLPRIIGEQGMGLFSMAYPIYSLILGLATMGFPVAISKLMAEKIALGDNRGALRVFRIALAALAAAGFAASAALVMGARLLATQVFLDDRAYLPLVAVAPAIFFVALMAGARAFFQGMQRMVPSALSQVVEQTVRVATVFVLAYTLLPKGVEHAAAGVTFGATTGAIAGLAYLAFLILRGDTLAVGSWLPRETTPAESATDILRRVLALTVPISLAAVVLPAMQFIDSVVVPSRLQSLGYPTEVATGQYGLLSGYAFPLVNLVTVFTGALAVSLVPTISEAAARHNRQRIGSRVDTAVRVTLLLTIPAAAGLYLFSREITTMLYNAPQAAAPLAALAAGTIFVGLQQVTSGVLQGLGRPDIPLRSLAIAALGKLGATWLLTGTLAYGIRGAAYGSVMGFLVAVSLNTAAVNARVGLPSSLVGTALRAGAAVLAMSIGARASYAVLYRVSASNTLATFGAIGAGVLVYGVAILGLGAVTAREIELLPRVGTRLAAILNRLGVLHK